jgi:hypothetical protein
MKIQLIAARTTATQRMTEFVIAIGGKWSSADAAANFIIATQQRRFSRKPYHPFELWIGILAEV